MCKQVVWKYLTLAQSIPKHTIYMSLINVSYKLMITMHLINRLLISFSCILNGNYPLSWILLKYIMWLVMREKGKRKVWTSLFSTYHRNRKLISVCEVIYFPLMAPCLLPKLSVKAPSVVIVNTSSWHYQLF